METSITYFPDSIRSPLVLQFFRFLNLENPEAIGERLNRQLRLPRQPASAPSTEPPRARELYYPIAKMEY